MSEMEQLMSESSGGAGSIASNRITTGDSQSSAGELIRRAREAAGLHIAALAVSLKVPVRKLEALEAGRFDVLPDAVFVRALASSVCRSLKIDAGPVLDRLPQTSAPKLTYQGAEINAPFRAPGDGLSPSLWAQVSRPAMLWGMALLLAALVLIMLPSIKNGVMDAKSAIAASGAVSPAASKTSHVDLTIPQEATNSTGVSPSATENILTSAPALDRATPLAAMVATSSPSPPVSVALPTSMAAK